MKTITRVVVVATALTVGGCNTYTLAPAGKPITVASTLNATPEIDWSRYQKGNVETWTVDGPLLEDLSFFSGIEDGSPLAPNSYWWGRQTTTQSEGKPPAFRKGMGSIEIAELVRDTYNRKGFQHFTIANIQPDRFAGQEGVRFDFTFVTKDGLDKEGLAVGAVIDDKLHIAIYTGAKEYYYAKYKDAVEQMLSSLTLQKS